MSFSLMVEAGDVLEKSNRYIKKIMIKRLFQIGIVFSLVIDFQKLCSCTLSVHEWQTNPTLKNSATQLWFFYTSDLRGASNDLDDM